MGKPINTPESDKSPFIHTDSRTFYFVSESSDYRWELEILIFSIPNKMKNPSLGGTKNIGYPINSEA